MQKCKKWQKRKKRKSCKKSKFYIFTTSTHFVFGTLYCDCLSGYQNLMRGLCVGKDMVILDWINRIHLVKINENCKNNLGREYSVSIPFCKVFSTLPRTVKFYKRKYKFLKFTILLKNTDKSRILTKFLKKCS